ncbi:MAG: SPOR domain-containing protein [Prevotella sp.]|nr:SPOR domain-containing protein [Prevotella sp.]
MKRLALIVAAMVCGLASGAQTYTTHLQSQSPGEGSVKVYQSEAIGRLVNGKINANSSSNVNANSSSNANASSNLNSSSNAGAAVETTCKREQISSLNLPSAAGVRQSQTKATPTTAKPAADKAGTIVQTSPAESNSALDSPAADTGKKVILNAQKVQGYRVQVFSGGNSRNDKNQAESIGEQIKRLFPDQPVYVHFYSPRWICRMGNYRTYDEAQAMLARVREAGFKQASLVKGTITPTD